MPARVYSTCTLPGCANPHYATGLCRGHYVARRAAAVRAASTAINAAPLAIVGGMTTAHRAAAMQAAQAVPAAPHLPTVPAAPCVPPAPVLPGSCAVPAPPADPYPTGNAAQAFGAAWEAQRKLAAEHGLTPFPPPVINPDGTSWPHDAPMLPIIPAPPVFPQSK